jgi:hypothetical protein
MKLTGKTLGIEGNPVPVVSTRDPALTRPGSNPDFRGEKLATKRI